MSPEAAPPPKSVWQKTVEAELGPLVWEPRRLRDLSRPERRQRGSLGILALGAGAVAILYGVAFDPSAPVSVTYPAVIFGALLIATGVLLFQGAKSAAPVPFAVFRDGLFLGASVDMAPGLEQMGGARLVRWEQVKRFEDRRERDGRALLFWTGKRKAAVATVSLDLPMKRKERNAVLEEFLAKVKEASGGRVGGEPPVEQ